MNDIPIEQYAALQPLVKRDIDNAIENLQQKQQYKVVKVPAHSHNGSDSPLVDFASLNSVIYHSQILTTTLTPAQVKALHTTPIQLVPAPLNTRSVIIVEGITGRLKFAGTEYDTTDLLEFRYTDGSGVKVTDDFSATFLQSSSTIIRHAPAVSATFVPAGGGSGNNGRIVVTVANADPTLGNSPVFITVKYHLVAFQI